MGAHQFFFVNVNLREMLDSIECIPFIMSLMYPLITLLVFLWYTVYIYLKHNDI